MAIERPVKFSNWEPTEEEIKNGTWQLSDLPHQSEIGGYRGTLTREFVRDTFDPVCDERSIAWTLVWGYPNGRIQTSRPNMKKAAHSAPAVAEAVEALRKEKAIPAHEILQRIHDVSEGIGPSTSSKIAYFADLRAREGQCLILDARVISSILYNRFDQLRPLIRKMLPHPPASYKCLGQQIVDAQKRQQAMYGEYVHQMAKLAQRRGVTPDILEAFLFANSPPSTTMTAILDEWDNIRGKSRRRK